jgi:hypothetical protein
LKKKDEKNETALLEGQDLGLFRRDGRRAARQQQQQHLWPNPPIEPLPLDLVAEHLLLSILDMTKHQCHRF